MGLTDRLSSLRPGRKVKDAPAPQEEVKREPKPGTVGWHLDNDAKTWAALPALAPFFSPDDFKSVMEGFLTVAAKARATPDETLTLCRYGAYAYARMAIRHAAMADPQSGPDVRARTEWAFSMIQGSVPRVLDNKVVKLSELLPDGQPKPGTHWEKMVDIAIEADNFMSAVPGQREECPQPVSMAPVYPRSKLYDVRDE